MLTGRIVRMRTENRSSATRGVDRGTPAVTVRPDHYAIPAILMRLGSQRVLLEGSDELADMALRHRFIMGDNRLGTTEPCEAIEAVAPPASAIGVVVPARREIARCFNRSIRLCRSSSLGASRTQGRRSVAWACTEPTDTPTRVALCVSWPSKLAMVGSPKSWARLAKLWRSTCGVMSAGLA